MAIDLNALRKFQDLWSPVMEAIPAVMDMAAKQADLERGLTKMAKDLAKAQAEVQKTYDEADARLIAVNKDLEAAIAAKAETMDSIEVAKRSAALAADEAAKKAAAKLADTDAKIKEKTATLASLDKEFAAKIAEAKAAMQTELDDLTAKIKDAEKRYATAEKALESLKAKLG
jgi:chromosome segregation ATPase